MIILYNNYVEDATITASSEATDYTFSVGLKDDRLSRVCRTTSATSQYLRFTFDEIVSPYYLIIQNHNLTENCFVTLKMFTENTWKDEVYNQKLNWDSGAICETIDTSYSETPFYLTDENGDNIISEIFDNLDYYIIDEYSNNLIDEDGGLIYGKYFEGTSNYDTIYGSTTQTGYKYIEISINDNENTDGYIEISKIYLGDYLQVYMDTGISIPHSSSSQVSKSVSGQLYGNRQLQYKAAKFTLSDVDKADIIPFWNTVDIVKPFWLLIWEEDTDIEPVIYCSLTKSLEYVKQPLNGNLYTVGMEIEEVF